LLITLIALALAYQTRAPVVLEMSSADQDIYLARGFYRPEEAFGVTYRWTDGDAQIHLPGLGSGVLLHLRISLHEFRPSPLSPGPVTILLNGRKAARFTPAMDLAAYDLDLPTGPVDWRGDAVGVLGGPLGVLAFMGYLGVQFGQPLAHLQVQALFFRGIRAAAFPGATLANYLSGLFGHPPATESVIEAGAMLLLQGVLALMFTNGYWIA
jgi:hypothetical protein